MIDKPLDGSHEQAARNYAYREGHVRGLNAEEEGK